MKRIFRSLVILAGVAYFTPVPAFAQFDVDAAQEETSNAPEKPLFDTDSGLSEGEKAARMKAKKLYFSYSSPEERQTFGGRFFCRISYTADNWSPWKVNHFWIRVTWPNNYYLDLQFSDIKPAENKFLMYEVPSPSICDSFKSVRPRVSIRACRMEGKTESECASMAEFKQNK